MVMLRGGGTLKKWSLVGGSDVTEGSLEGDMEFQPFEEAVLFLFSLLYFLAPLKRHLAHHTLWPQCTLLSYAQSNRPSNHGPNSQKPEVKINLASL